MEKKPSQILQEALNSFGPKGERWTKDSYIKWKIMGKTGRTFKSKCPPLHKETLKDVCFCSMGALFAATEETYVNKGELLIYTAELIHARFYLSKVVGINISHWNDNPSRKFSEVKEAFEKAIELAKSEEK